MNKFKSGRGGKRKNAGRKAISLELKRKHLGSYKIPTWIIDRLKNEYPRQGGHIIEKSLLYYTNWKLS